ncbi:hypothetical protein SAMN05216199_3014 [Pedococcus cremeus]|uniref:Uncharacterized protein n=1 Tax=Pedococcus cremeus TaxID=587636 RepID=A0A1H9WM17_9MICO|nr:hypothetical protein SAMN05216199_3014 [Pedococcus cremeus]
MLAAVIGVSANGATWPFMDYLTSLHHLMGARGG